MSEFLAWPGQNWPEWLWWEKGMSAPLVGYSVIGTCLQCLDSTGCKWRVEDVSCMSRLIRRSFSLTESGYLLQSAGVKRKIHAGAWFYLDI